MAGKRGCFIHRKPFGSKKRKQEATSKNTRRQTCTEISDLLAGQSPQIGFQSVTDQVVESGLEDLSVTEAEAEL